MRSPAHVEGTQGLLLRPEKDLKSPSSMRLEARFPYHDSRAMTRSPSPLAWRLDFPGGKDSGSPKPTFAVRLYPKLPAAHLLWLL